MTHSQRSRTALAVLFLVSLTAVPAFATPLLPGATVVPGAISIAGEPVLADTGVQAIVSSTPNDWTATLAVQVLLNLGGTLDFAYQFHNDASSATALGRVTGSNFASIFSTDALVDTGSSLGLGAATPGLLPASADRGTCPSCLVVGFSFNDTPTKVLPGQTTPVLVVRTDAKEFTAGFASLINSGVGAGAGFEPTAPAAVPEPATWWLMGTGLAALVGRWVRRRIP